MDDTLLADVLSLEDDVPRPTIRFDVVDDIYETKFEPDINEIGKGESLPSLDEEVSYKIQFDSLISWFLRSSSNFKLKCMHRMLQTLKDKSHLDIILLSLNFRMDKTRIYSRSLPNTNYIYDIKLNDHNRALERNFLEETLNIGIAWFETLSSHEQIETILELLKRAGAALVDKFYDLALKYKKDSSLTWSREEDIQDVLPDISHCSRTSSQQEISKNPFLVEIEKRSKTFNEALLKYTNQIMGINEKAKTPRSGKKSRKSSGKKSEKSSKSSRKQSGHASPKGKEKKLVNQGLVIDQKNMKYKTSDLSSISKRKAPKLSIAQNRMKKLTGRGAIHPNLRTTNNSKTTYPILMERATREATSHLVMPTTGYESFPRNVPNNQILLATPTCILNEIGKQPHRAQENASTKRNTEKIGASDLELTDEGQKYGRRK